MVGTTNGVNIDFKDSNRKPIIAFSMLFFSKIWSTLSFRTQVTSDLILGRTLRWGIIGVHRGGGTQRYTEGGYTDGGYTDGGYTEGEYTEVGVLRWGYLHNCNVHNFLLSF